VPQAEAPPLPTGRSRVGPFQPALADRRSPTATFILIAALALTLAGLVLAIRTSFFYQDDYLNMGLARQEGLGLTLLKWSVFGELAPGHRFLDWLMGVDIGLQWVWAMAIMLACWAVAVVAFERLLSELSERRWLVIFGTLLFACSPAFVRLMQWWANGEHEMPWIALTFVCVLASLRWLLRREARWLVLAVASYIGALLFYAESVLTPVFVVALAYFLPSGVQRTLSKAKLREDLPLLALFVIVTLLYVAAVEAGEYLGVPKRAGLGTWLAYYRIEWLQGVTPWLVGQSTVPNTGAVAPAVAVVAQVVLLGVVAGSLVRSRLAWRAWAFYLVIWAVGAFIVGNGRLGLYGPTMAYDPRYNAEMTFILPLSIVLALGLPRAAASGPRFGGVRLGVTLPRAWIAGVVLAAALATSVAISDARLADAWPAGQAGAWAAHVRFSVAALRRRGIEPSVLDGDVPPTVEPENQEQFSLLSRVLPMFRDGIVVDDQTGRDPPALVQPNGTVALAVPHVLASWSAPQLLNEHLLARPSDVARTARQGAVCAAAVAGGPVLLPLSPRAPLGSADTVLELLLPADRSDGTLFVYLDTGGGYPIGPSKVLVMHRRDRVLRVELPGRLVRARFDLQPGARACISEVRVVRYS
jgi:hypothetical protein